MIDVMIITYNESANLPHCLPALAGWTHRVFVVDSGSTDGTQDIAREHDATVVHHDWEGYARQKNWGLKNLPFESGWVLIVDADEVVTYPVRACLEQIAARPIDEVEENGFFINRLTYFNNQPIRHCGYFPSWNMRFFKRGKGVYEDREVHEHLIIDNPVGYIREPMLHNDRRGLEHYFAKHNRYSTLEARSLLLGSAGHGSGAVGPNLPVSNRLNRWLKRYIMPWIPLPGMWRFLYMYIIRLGVLDGRAGLAFCKMISLHDRIFSLKLREALRQGAKGFNDSLPNPVLGSVKGLVEVEGSISVIPDRDEPRLGRGHDQPVVQTQPEASPWSMKEKIGRGLWMVLGRPIFRVSFHNWHRYRVGLLRLFGAKVGQNVAIRSTVRVEVPWMLQIDDDAVIGDDAILYSLGPIRIGKRSIISQYAHLCAGTHDYTDHAFKLIRSSITIGDDVWIGADAFVGPGVKVGRLSVLGARSSTYKDLPGKQVYVGNPAHAIKERVLQ